MIIKKHNVDINSIDAFIFDFDGVLTDNFVNIDQHGVESVRCSRSDGLAFDLLKKLNKKVFILSTEKNSVVSARAKKLKIPVIQGSINKVDAIYSLVKNNNFSLKKIFYIGNDLNDYRAMKLCGYTACPIDSHPIIKQTAMYVLKAKGGDGIAREILECILQLDFIKILYPN
jgi:YrbI family 3-deoxy-D-manno-octulosonate 8-phosphate phosphatase